MTTLWGVRGYHGCGRYHDYYGTWGRRAFGWGCVISFFVRGGYPSQWDLFKGSGICGLFFDNVIVGNGILLWDPAYGDRFTIIDL